MAHNSYSVPFIPNNAQEWQRKSNYGTPVVGPPPIVTDASTKGDFYEISRSIFPRDRLPTFMDGAQSTPTWKPVRPFTVIESPTYYNGGRAKPYVRDPYNSPAVWGVDTHGFHQDTLRQMRIQTELDSRTETIRYITAQMNMTMPNIRPILQRTTR